VLVCKEGDLEVGHPVKVTIDDVTNPLVKDTAGAHHALGDTCSQGEI
jgi:3-phenylpropionate/trans-cinnamate dioxygenase ferredoxin subunit